MLTDVNGISNTMGYRKSTKLRIPGSSKIPERCNLNATIGDLH